MFGESAVAETPATDPKSVIGRNVSVSLSELLGEGSKEFMNLIFKIEKVSGRYAYTRFNGIVTVREYIARFVRKRVQKVETVDDFTTKDGWKIRVKTVTILNRNTETTIKKKMRAHIRSFLKEKIAKSTIEDVVRSVIAGNLQNNIRKSGNKIYPVRFFEISKIE
ncbi:MAG: hypothetical protein DRP54_08070, partial [Spirochaetes bacterium]